MDISQYINDNLDEIIENPDSLLNNNINPLEFLKHNESNDSNQFSDFDDSDLDLGSDSNSDDENQSIKNNLNPNEIETNIKEPNEDDYADDIECELYQNMYEKKVNFKKPHRSFDKNIEKNNLEDLVNGLDYNDDDDSDADSDNLEDTLNTQYYFDLMNIFLRYYNEKYDKTDNFFTGIKNTDSDTSNCMELFFESIFEYEQFKQKILEDLKNVQISDDSINDLVMKFIFEESESEKIENLFETWQNQIYCLSYQNKKYFSPSLLICLNFINKNNIIYESWNIYNLRDN